jgi:3-hydroxyisobutyrate dehydrogenase-like beta-hydroxyacid dehydrogenase
MSKTVGVVGLGNMGFGMAENLLKAGFAVRGFDVRQEPRERLAAIGGTGAASAAEAGAGADVVLIMVMDAGQVRDTISGNGGLLESMIPGATVILSSTIGVTAAQEAGQMLAEHGVALLDCCVSGGLRGAVNGTLSLMVGAPEDVFAAQLDVLSAVGDPEKIVRVGSAAGDGQAVKCCVQALIAITYTGVFESLVLGTKLGIDPSVLQQVIGSSIAGSPLFRLAAEHIAKREFTDTGSHIFTMYKDIDITLKTARDAGAPLPATAFAAQFIDASMTRFPEEDCWSMVKFFENLAGVEVGSAH